MPGKSATHRVAIIGCGRLGQHYAQAYSTYPDTEIVAIAGVQRQAAAGGWRAVRHHGPVSRCPCAARGRGAGHCGGGHADQVLQRGRHRSAEAGVKGVSTDKPIAGILSDADTMVEVVPGARRRLRRWQLQRAMSEVQEVARRIHAGQYGPIIGASVHRWGSGEISGGGCQHVAVLRLLADAEVDEVIAWGTPAEALAGDTDEGLVINAGSTCPTARLRGVRHGNAVPGRGRVERGHADPLGLGTAGDLPRLRRARCAPAHRAALCTVPLERVRLPHVVHPVVLAAVETGSELAISGHDLRQALEVAIAAKVSAQRGSVPIKLPLADRSLSLYPRRYRWLGGDADGQPHRWRRLRAAETHQPYRHRTAHH